ncbi:MAG: hypothetical protein IIW79_00820 [Clostridia bacterium]|nr:hypothetical protein [Clostridia bacterium]
MDKFKLVSAYKHGDQRKLEYTGFSILAYGGSSISKRQKHRLAQGRQDMELE